MNGSIGRSVQIGILLVLLSGCLAESTPPAVDVPLSFYNQGSRPDVPDPTALAVEEFPSEAPLTLDAPDPEIHALPRIRMIPSPSGADSATTQPIVQIDPTPSPTPGPPPVRTIGQWVEEFSKKYTVNDDQREKMMAMLSAFHLMVSGRENEGLEALSKIHPTGDDFTLKMLEAMLWRELGESGRAAKLMEDLLIELRQDAPLTIDSLLLAEWVESKGRYKEFSTYSFEAGQEVIVYLEPRSFKCLKAGKGEFQTELEITLQVLDRDGAPQKDWTVPVKHVTKSYLFDFFVCVNKVAIPVLAAGEYTMKISVRDMGSPEAPPAVKELKFKIKA